ncbi:hypothetical protein PA598K_06807 [Paenibacillus sp. 598K]|uniref:glycosyltransferase family 4 protein n=1 Tax=Paenibacillus sp. 598K TaxID=1117987 RepID=UPI000FF9A87D|nr:glycosyltransferase family 4 protein [Paenibacillus sp. 598K]GBF78196.1 hypothetical protein PA598K_06807 [Paenibacillus sp. 598K]
MKILLVPDSPGWAFDNRAKDLLTLRWNGIYLNKKYQPQVHADDQKRYDLIYPMSLSIARRLHRAGIPLHKMATGITSLRIFEKKKLSGGGFDAEFLSFIRQLRGINAWSDEIVNSFKPYCSIAKTRIGIREDRFRPALRRRAGGMFTVGWAGRMEDAKSRELKGYDIVVEALKGLCVKFEIRSFKDNYVPRTQMASFYQGLDCFICSSRSEGLPNPVLEAAACGVPIITTRVGIVPELIKHGSNGLIAERQAEAIRNQVKWLMRHPDQCVMLGQAIRQTIERHWTWEICKKEWETFFLSLR